MFKLTLKICGVEYKTKGETVIDALGALDLTWDKIKSKGIVKVETKDSVVEHYFSHIQLRRIFANKLTRIMWGKRLELLLKPKV